MTRSPLFIVNPQAGGGRAARLMPRLRAWLALHGIAATVRETAARGDAERFAAGAAGAGHDRVVAVGGDGTFQEVVNGLLAGRPDASPVVGLIPAGRGNDVARELGLPADPEAGAQVALGDATRAFDVAHAADAGGAARCFAAAGGVGFDAQVAHTMMFRRKFWMRGEAGYMLATVNELRRFRNHELRLTLRDAQGEHTLAGRFLFVAFANGACYGGGMRICPQARTDDGLLDVCLVGDLSRLAALRELPGIYAARHVRHPQVRLLRVRSLTIEGEAGIRSHLDGEPFGALPLHVGVRPAALRVACSTIDGL